MANDQTTESAYMMDAVLQALPLGLPANILIIVLAAQGVSDASASAAIRRGLDRGTVRLGSNMNIVREEDQTDGR